MSDEERPSKRQRIDNNNNDINDKYKWTPFPFLELIEDLQTLIAHKFVDLATLVHSLDRAGSGPLRGATRHGDAGATEDGHRAEEDHARPEALSWL